MKTIHFKPQCIRINTPFFHGSDGMVFLENSDSILRKHRSDCYDWRWFHFGKLGNWIESFGGCHHLPQTWTFLWLVVTLFWDMAPARINLLEKATDIPLQISVLKPFCHPSCLHFLIILSCLNLSTTKWPGKLYLQQWIGSSLQNKGAQINFNYTC